VVFRPELGDRSQLITTTYAPRYRWWVVLLGVSLASRLRLNRPLPGCHAANPALGLRVSDSVPDFRGMGVARGHRRGQRLDHP
jgi:hypothetical protein